ncbi:MAG: acyltransferase [Sphingobium sp.]|nr:acyltransferase [Sphingobium sp.]
MLDSLRGVAACFIVLYHIVASSSFWPAPFLEHAWLFVDFFFVLSGFVIGFSYGDRLEEGYPIGRYMLQRFFRIYPLLLVMLLVYLAFEIVFALAGSGAASRQPFDGIYSVPSFISALFMAQIFFGPDNLPWNGPSWSVAAEFWTYLIFALAMRIRRRLIVPLCLLTVLIVPVYLAYLTDRNMGVFHDGALARCLFGFATGVLCWKLPERIREHALPRWADHLLEFTVVGLCVAFVTIAGVDRLSLAAPLVFVLAVGVFSRERGVLSALLKRAAFVTVGNLSYSIYMIHWFLLWRFFNMLALAERITGLDLVATRDGQTGLGGSPALQVASMLVFLAGVLLAAFLSYRLIEKPGQKLGKMLIARQGEREVPNALPAKV